jgi:hypothetical protein
MMCYGLDVYNLLERRCGVLLTKVARNEHAEVVHMSVCVRCLVSLSQQHPNQFPSTRELAMPIEKKAPIQVYWRLLLDTPSVYFRNERWMLFWFGNYESAQEFAARLCFTQLATILVLRTHIKPL